MRAYCVSYTIKLEIQKPQIEKLTKQSPCPKGAHFLESEFYHKIIDMYNKSSPYSKGAHCLEKEFIDTKTHYDIYGESYDEDKHRNQRARSKGTSSCLAITIPCRVPRIISV